MLAHLMKTAVRQSRLLRPTATLISAVPRRFYYPEGKLMKREEGEYYADPVQVAERMIRLIALHDNVKDPSAVTLNHSFDELGFNVLDMQEIFLAAEREFDIEISEEDCESFQTVNDIVENIARNFYTKWENVRLIIHLLMFLSIII